MPQNVKIQTGFSEKVTENFQSTQHSISLEMDCAINGNTREIEEASQKLFALCRKIVSAQKSVNVDSLLNNDMPVNLTTFPPAPQTPSFTPAPAPQQPTGNGSSTRPATTKQIKFILELAKKSNLSHDEILALPLTYQRERFEQLSASQASALIDRFNMKNAA
jgi:hypothetical protein